MAYEASAYEEEAPAEVERDDLGTDGAEVATTDDADDGESESDRLEAVARELGWTPKDKWRGDPKKWTSAEDYIRDTGRRAKQQATQRREAEAEYSERIERLERAHRESLKRTAQQTAAEVRRQYEQAKKQAARDGNDELFDQLAVEQEQELERIRAQATAVQEAEQITEQQAQAILSDPVANRFFQANPIAVQDERAWNAMERAMDAVAARGGTPAQQFRAAEEALRYAFPEAYAAGFAEDEDEPQPRRQRDDRGRFASADEDEPPQQEQRPAARRAAPRYESASPRSSGSEDRLPPEAVRAMQEEISAGRIKSEKEFKDIYFGRKTNVI